MLALWGVGGRLKMALGGRSWEWLVLTSRPELVAHQCFFVFCQLEAQGEPQSAGRERAGPALGVKPT